MAHLFNEGVIRNSAKEDGYAAWKREVKKNKYNEICLPTGHSVNMIPLVFFCNITEHEESRLAQGYLKEISKQSFDGDGLVNTLIPYIL